MIWHKANDRLPEPDKPVLVFDPRWADFRVMYIDAGDGKWYPGGSTNWDKQWTELPDPPEKEA